MADLADILEDAFDVYVAEAITFDSWGAMVVTASQQWFVAQIRD